MRTGGLVGFGGGTSRISRRLPGLAVPMASVVSDVAAARRDYLDEAGGRYVHVIAVGGIGNPVISRRQYLRTYAMVIASPLARAPEAPGGGVHWGSESWHPVLPGGERPSVGPVGRFAGNPAPASPMAR